MHRKTVDETEMLIVLLDAYSDCIALPDLSLVSVPHPWPKQVYGHEAVMEMGLRPVLQLFNDWIYGNDKPIAEIRFRAQTRDIIPIAVYRLLIKHAKRVQRKYPRTIARMMSQGQ